MTTWREMYTPAVARDTARFLTRPYPSLAAAPIAAASNRGNSNRRWLLRDGTLARRPVLAGSAVLMKRLPRVSRHPRRGSRHQSHETLERRALGACSGDRLFLRFLHNL